MIEPILYLDWVKRKAPPPNEKLSWGLALSGLPDPNPDFFKEVTRDLPLFGTNHNFWLPLKEILAYRYHCDLENVLPTFGTSQANFIAISALIQSADPVLIEMPVYEPLVTIVKGISTNIHYLTRRPELNWNFDLDELKDVLWKMKPKLFILTNPHNPTGTYYLDKDFEQICELAQQTNTILLVDEVYRDAVKELQERSTFQLAKNVVITSSLTKCYGLSALRIGWMIAPKQLIQNAELFHDRIVARNPLILEELANRILRNQPLLDKCGKERWNRLEQNRIVLEEIVQKHSWEVVIPKISLVVFIKIRNLNWKQIDQKAQNAGVLLTYGGFFGDATRFRIALTAEPEEFQTLIKKLEMALTSS